MKTDSEIEKEIMHILEHDPAIDATHVSVEVKDGVVKLAGFVHSSAAKWMAKEAIKHIHGIQNIIVELDVNPPSSLVRGEP